MANIHVAKVTPNVVYGGDKKIGFGGEVPANELFTEAEILNIFNLKGGVRTKYVNEPWLKFYYNGKVLFRYKKSIVHSVSGQTLFDAEVCFGEKIIQDKKGNKYKVRLMEGAVDKKVELSEWNQLIYPITQMSGGWGINYSYDDLNHGGGNHQAGGYGNVHWTNDLLADTKGKIMTIRGHSFTSYSQIGISSVFTTTGWSPVLELISPSKTRYILKKDNDYGYYKTGTWHSLGNSLPECNVIKTQGMSSLETLNPGDYEFTHLMTARAPTKQYNGVINFNDEGLKNIKRIDVREVEIDG